jgi:hypothetical protein
MLREPLQKFLELFDRETGVLPDAAHRKRVHRIMSRNREMRWPSVMTMCFPFRAIRNPAFWSARTASR